MIPTQNLEHHITCAKHSATETVDNVKCSNDIKMFHIKHKQTEFYMFSKVIVTTASKITTFVKNYNLRSLHGAILTVSYE